MRSTTNHDHHNAPRSLPTGRHRDRRQPPRWADMTGPQRVVTAVALLCFTAVAFVATATACAWMVGTWR